MYRSIPQAAIQPIDLQGHTRRVHGHSVHVGRRYDPPQGEVLERAATLSELRALLQRAVEGEEFETAASLRDKIRGLE